MAKLTRDEFDGGVEMETDPGTDERQGPEDALGPGARRGTYAPRIPAHLLPHSGSDDQLADLDEIEETNGQKGGVDNVTPTPTP